MTAVQFQEQLRRTGVYQSPALRGLSRDSGEGVGRRTWADRLFGWTDLWYHLLIVRLVIRAAGVVRRTGYDNAAWAESSLEAARAIEVCGGTIDISGFEHVAAIEGPRVFVSNHMSALETILLPIILLSGGDLTIVLKEALLRYPLFGSVLGAIEPISVTRKNARRDLVQVLTQGQASLAKGNSVLLFPQATRSPVFDAERFNTLGVKLAGRAGVPVIPVALKTDFQGIGRLIKDLGPLDRGQTVRVRFGPAIAPGKDAERMQAEVVEFIATNLRSWGSAVAAPGSA